MAVPIDVESLDFSALGSRSLPRPPAVRGGRFPGIRVALGIGLAALTFVMLGVLTVGYATGALEVTPAFGPVLSMIVGYLLLLAIAAGCLAYVYLALVERPAPPPDPHRLERFAAVNGLRHTAFSYGAPHRGTGFQGDLVRLVDHIGPEFGEDFDYGTVTSTGGINDPNPREWGYLAVRLERRLPLLVLRSATTRLPSFDGAEVVDLPPKYGDAFELLAEPGGADEARALFTPALLTLLSPPRNAFDVEVLGDRLYAYAKPFDLRRPAVHARLLRIVRLVWELTAPAGPD